VHRLCLVRLLNAVGAVGAVGPVGAIADSGIVAVASPLTGLAPASLEVIGTLDDRAETVAADGFSGMTARTPQLALAFTDLAATLLCCGGYFLCAQNWF
jgi:hypothetical protein